MATTLEDMLAELPADRRAKVEARTAELLREEMTLAELRKAARKTQVSVARRLHVEQASVSQMERRGDMLLSTLRKYVEAMGGALDLVARLPGREPVHLTGLSDLDPEERAPARRARDVERSEAPRAVGGRKRAP